MDAGTAPARNRLAAGAWSPYAPGHATSDALEALDVAGAWREIDWRDSVVMPGGQALAHAR